MYNMTSEEGRRLGHELVDGVTKGLNKVSVADLERWEQERQIFRSALESFGPGGINLDRDYLAEAREQIEHIPWANVECFGQAGNIRITVSLTIEGLVYEVGAIESPATFVYAMTAQGASPPYMHRMVRSLCYQAMGEFSAKELNA